MVKQCNPKAKIITIVVVVVLVLAIVALSVLAIIDNAYSSPKAISATRLYGYIMYPQVRLLSTSVSDNGNPFDLGYSQYNMLVSGAYLPADMSSADIDIYSQQVQYDMRAGSYSIVAGQDTLDMWQSTALRQSVFFGW